MTRAAALLWVGVSMVAVRTCSAQILPAVGGERTLDIATWNIEHFGNDGLEPDDETQIANAATIIRQSEIDLWAVQEIEDEGDFQRLIDAIGDEWAGIVDQRSTNLHVGFIYNEDVIRVRNVANILTEFSSVFAGRPPLQIEVDVTLPDTSIVMTFITLHMKAFGNVDSYSQREAASKHLKNHVDFTTLNTRPVVILGDFNDRLTSSITSGRSSPYQNFLADTSDFFFMTLDLELSGTNTFCFSARCASGSTIDHILITDELYAASGKRSAETYDEVFDDDPFYLSTTSDHLPVFASFQFAENTSRKSVPDHHFRIGGVFPNPVRAHGTLEFSTAAPERVSILLIDVLGRKMRVFGDRFIAAGRHTLDLDLSDLNQGTYFLHVRTGQWSAVKPIVVMR